MLETVLTEERMVVGDSAGYVHQFDEDLTQDDDVDIPSVHITEVYDLGMPGKNKLWPGIRVTAKGTSMAVQYRTSDFETEDDGWSQWVLPTGYSDPDSKWSDEALAYDKDNSTAATSTSQDLGGGFNWQSVLTFLYSGGLNCNSIRYKANFRAGIITQIKIRIYSGSWETVYEGVFTDALTTVTFSDRTVTQAEISFYVAGSGRTQSIYEFALGEVVTTSLTSEFVDYDFTVWDTSKKIQFRFLNYEGDDFQISNYELISPAMEAEV